MRRFGHPLLLLALSVGLAVPAAQTAAAADKKAAAIGGFIAGAAIGAAIGEANHSPQIIVNNYGARRPDGGGGWASAYRPGNGNVVCYPRQHACYHASGAYAPNVTWREFGVR